MEDRIFLQPDKKHSALPSATRAVKIEVREYIEEEIIDEVIEIKMEIDGMPATEWIAHREGLSPTRFAASDVSAVSPTFLPLDTPPCTADKEYWTMKSSFSSCPRGCDIRISENRTCRINHYKRFHYDSYFALVNGTRWTALERWIYTQFGEIKNNRVCVICGHGRLYYRNRVELAKHIQSTHPNEFLSLSRHYCAIAVVDQIPDLAVHHILTGSDSTEDIPTSASLLPPAKCAANLSIDEVAAAPFNVPETFEASTPAADRLLHPPAKRPASLSLEMISGAAPAPSNVPHAFEAVPATDSLLQQPVIRAASPPIEVVADTATRTSYSTFDHLPPDEDQDYCSGKTSVHSCPRACSFSSSSAYQRRKHYKQFHYDIFFAKSRFQWTPVERWMSIHFGADDMCPRVCLRCVGQRRGSADYRTRIELTKHIQSVHTHEFLSLARDYSVLSANEVPDNRRFHLHMLLMDEVAKNGPTTCTVQQTGSLAARSSMMVAPSLRPPSIVDEDYWNGHSVTVACPRGCYFFDGGSYQRRNHYKQNHYNIYYTMIWIWSRLERWLRIQFGKPGLDARVCVRCVGDPHNPIYHQSRIDLVKHIQSVHHDEFLVLAQDYCNLPDGQIPDREVHRILVNTVMIFQ